MKRLIALIALVLSMPVLAAGGDMTGQERDAKAGLYVGAIRGTVLQLKEANKVGSALDVEDTRHTAGTELTFNGWVTYENELAKHNEDGIKQNAFNIQVADQVNSHNGICGGTVSDQSTYDWCVKNAARLESLRAQVADWASRVNKSKDRLDKNKEMLLQASTLSNVSGEEIYQKGLKYLEKYDMLVRRVKEFSARLNQLQIGYDVCKNAQGTMEKVHEMCGSMFDGNIVHETETNYPVPDIAFKFDVIPRRCTPQKLFCYESHK